MVGEAGVEETVMAWGTMAVGKMRGKGNGNGSVEGESSSTATRRQRRRPVAAAAVAAKGGLRKYTRDQGKG